MRSKVSRRRPRHSRKYVKKTRNKKRASKGTRKRSLSRKRVSGIRGKKTTKRKRYKIKNMKKTMRGGVQRNLGLVYNAIRRRRRRRRAIDTPLTLAPIVNETAQIVGYIGNEKYVVKSLHTDHEFEVGTGRIIPYDKRTGERDVRPETNSMLLRGELPVDTKVELRPIESGYESDETDVGGYGTDVG